jgi:hypothetical protein
MSLVRDCLPGGGLSSDIVANCLLSGPSRMNLVVAGGMGGTHRAASFWSSKSLFVVP